jgi:glyoxylase-like metal-dependent hydrolase (beta-lactamase superfamily II)
VDTRAKLAARAAESGKQSGKPPSGRPIRSATYSIRQSMTIELVTTTGIFALDGGEWEVTNNIWLAGNDQEVWVIDAAHDHLPIIEAVNGRRVPGVILTHGHNDHINAAAAVADAIDAPIYMHPADTMLWNAVYPNRSPDRDLPAGNQAHRWRDRTRRSAHAGTFARMLLLLRRRQRRAVQR